MKKRSGHFLLSNHDQPNYRFWAGIVILGLMVLTSTFAHLISNHGPDALAAPAANRYLAPSSGHWFGTDQFGRDLFTRVLHGGRITLLIALAAVSLSLLIGVGYGAIAGYFGGIVDRVLMRMVDALLSFPIMFLTVTCMALLGSGLLLLIVILTFTSWMDIARLVRAEVHSLKSRPFILKARAAGLGTLRIVSRHLIPNALATVSTVAILRFADIILIESALSFFGLGVQPPTATWGSIINDGRSVLTSAWWLVTFPGIAIWLTTTALNLIGGSLTPEKGKSV